MIKVDLRKAYDFVEWQFIEQILKELGFPLKMCTWIMKFIRTVQYTFNVNGKLTTTIQAKIGMRQGDPMCPYIFVFVMEYLNMCLKGLKKDPDYIYHPRCKKLDITHLCFADYLLLFAKEVVLSVTRLKEKFEMFSTASGLKANLSKSKVFFSGVKQNIQQQILQELKFEKGELPFKYLGVPLSTKRVTVQQCKTLVERITTRITS